MPLKNKWETLYAPENAPEIGLILRALPLLITYDVFQKKTFLMCSVKLNMTL